MLDPDTFTSPETATLAKLAAGAAILAVDHCLASAHAPGGGDRPHWRGSVPGALALVRPPGHHAEAGSCDGFLLLQQRRRRGGACTRARRRARRDRRLTTCITATARSTASTTIRRSCSSRRISTRSIPGTGAASEIGAARARASRSTCRSKAAPLTATTTRVFDAIVVPVLRAVRAGAAARLRRLRRARARPARRRCA